MDKTLQVQAQIRQNAEGISSALSDISKWEKQVKIKDKKIIENTTIKGKLPVRSGVGTVPIKNASISLTQNSHNSGVESHTPSSIVNILNNKTVQPTIPVAKARGVFIDVDPEDAERERGNNEFKNGNFTAAVKSYTKCLGMKSKNYVAFSNRAMAYLKLKEYNRAVTDCNGALSIEPTHVKSLLRRATAYNALGKHRAALVDLQLAQEIEPTSKLVRSELQCTKELLRSAVNRAPLVSMPVYFDSVYDSEDGVILPLQGPDPAPSAVETTAVNSISDMLKLKPSVSDTNGKDSDITHAVSPSKEENSTVSTTATEPVSHRVTIVDSDEEEDAVVPDTDTNVHNSNIVKASGSHRVAIVVSDDEKDESGDISSTGKNVTNNVKTTNIATEKSSVNSTVPSGMRRIPIIADSSDDEDEADNNSNTLNNDVRHSQDVVDRIGIATAKVSSKTEKRSVVKEPSSDKKKSNKSSTPSKTNKTNTTSPANSKKLVARKYTVYELERELMLALTRTSSETLVEATMKLSILEKIFANLDVSSIKSSLKGLMEPNVLYLLLRGVYEWLTSTIGNGSNHHDVYVKVMQYYETIAMTKEFAFVYTLLSMEEKVDIMARVKVFSDYLLIDVDVEKDIQRRVNKVVNAYNN